MRLVVIPLGVIVVVSVSPAAHGSCTQRLADTGVSFERAHAAHIHTPVRITGPLGGVAFKPYTTRDLLIDCELALALEESGTYFAEHGIVKAVYSSAYSRRRIRKTGRWSHHAFAKAIDVHEFELRDGTVLRIADHFEQGLGDDQRCVGEPLTREGAILKALSCSLKRSGLYDNVLDPDYDAHHFNHFHLDVAR